MNLNLRHELSACFGTGDREQLQYVVWAECAVARLAKAIQLNFTRPARP